MLRVEYYPSMYICMLKFKIGVQGFSHYQYKTHLAHSTTGGADSANTVTTIAVKIQYNRTQSNAFKIDTCCFLAWRSAFLG